MSDATVKRKKTDLLKKGTHKVQIVNAKEVHDDKHKNQ